MNWARWEGAVRCTGKVTPGARALLAWLLEGYSPPGRSGGIYNCRTVVGGTSTSLHGEGRAVDFMLPVQSNGRPTAVGQRTGDEIVKRLGAHGRRLGVQCVIWDRRIHSASSPNGRPYTGVHPHYDHLHIELTWAAANNLTLATLRAVLTEEEVMDYRVGCGWAENETARNKVARMCEARQLKFVPDGPAFIFHATISDSRIKEVEMVIDADSELHRFHGIPTNQSSYRAFGVATTRWPGAFFVVRTLDSAKEVAKRVADELVRLANDLRGA